VTAVVDAASGVSLANAVLTTSVGSTTYTTGMYYWGSELGVKAVTITRPNLSLLEAGGTLAAGSRLISPRTAVALGKYAGATAKASGVVAAVGLGIEGGVLGACR